MPARRKTAKVKRSPLRAAAKPERSIRARRRALKPTAAQLRQRQELERLRSGVAKLRSDLRRVRTELRQQRAESDRLRTIEREADALRRELGPQRPLLPLPDPATEAVREPWMPPVVEAHLTALHDHDAAAVDGIFAPDVLITEMPFPQASRRGQSEATAWHAELFATWTDFRFMPHHWHNIGGAAFLEGEARFIQRGERHGMRAQGKPVSLDMLLVYHLSGAGIGRLKLYYDAALLLRQLAAPGAQGELF